MISISEKVLEVPCKHCKLTSLEELLIDLKDADTTYPACIQERLCGKSQNNFSNPGILQKETLTRLIVSERSCTKREIRAMASRKLFRIFLWKNRLFVFYNWVSLLIIFGGCLAITLIYLNSTDRKTIIPSAQPDLTSVGLLQQNFPANDGDYLYYAPRSKQIDDLMESVRQELQISGDALQPFDNVTAMRLQQEQSCIGNCFAVYFEEYPDNVNRDFTYSISSSAMRLSPKKRYVNDEEINGVKEEDEYMRTGFFTLQHVIDRKYIGSRAAGSIANFDLNIAILPSKEQEVSDSHRMIYFGSIFSVLFNVLLLSTFLVPLVEEKQNGLKEFLVIATPLNFLNGLTFYLVRLLLYAIFLGFVLICASYYSALGTVPCIYVILLFVLYMLSTMTYTYLISVCFNSVLYAKVGGLLLLVVPYIFYLAEGTCSFYATFLFSTKTFMEGIQVLQIYTNKYLDFTASDLFVKITQSSFRMSTLFAFLIAQCLLYTLLYNYLSYVFPGPGGLKKPFTFPFKPSFYRKRKRNQYTTKERGTDAIIIQDLVKKFKTPTREIVIADRLNMVIKNKQITVLLGHNGVGKTTTMNMIMGSEPKDSGKIIVCSERDVLSYRHLIGFCPQHSVFMHYMTCRQHLQFFAELRGMSENEAISVSNELLKQLKLTEKADQYGRCLSGGMRRRLSLGIAISGETKIVILDEPSSGLDVESRRELWDILLELRRTKAVLVTTHHMEEAEVLGDTICILSNGRLPRTGTPLELKRKYGSGYILKLCTNKNFKEIETLAHITQTIPDAKVLHTVPPTVSISLPYEYRTEYSFMLQILEERKDDLGIDSLSVTDTSLEDVFLKCAVEMDEVDAPRHAKIYVGETRRVPYTRLNSTIDVTMWQQFTAILYKKLIYLMSERVYLLLMVLLPLFAISLAIVMMQTTSAVNSKALPLNLQHIGSGVVYIRNTAAYQNFADILNNQTENYKIKSIRLPETSSITEEMIKMQEQNLGYFLQNVIGAIDIQKNDDGNLDVKMYFSGNVYHSSVILLNLIDNTVLKLGTGGGGVITTSYTPIARYIADVSPTRLEYYAVIVPIGLFFYMFFYLSLPYRENSTGFRSLQAVPRVTYWSSFFILDALQHFIICLLIFGLQYFIMPKQLYSTSEQFSIVCAIFVYGISYLPLLYSFANGFRSISTISTYLLFMLITSAITPLITSGNIQAMQAHETKIMFLSLLPDFNLNHQLRIINERFVLFRRSSDLRTKDLQLLSLDAFYFFAFITFVITSLIFLYVLQNMRKCQQLRDLYQSMSCYSCRTVSNKDTSNTEDEENLVQNEKNAVDKIIAEGRQSEYPLLVRDLYKFYDRKQAVRGLNFAVNRKECFGLLGVNGAGKTTTFQMITANSVMTSGTIKIDGVDLLEQENEYRHHFGYCPQYDCLNDFMTAKQTLKYMAKLRGVSGADMKEEVMYWIEKLDLIKYQKVKVRHYSGGTKRKLNAAVAMIGSPSLVLLDEPTTGVDPVSRRFLWQCIKEFQKRDKTIVLTSHSMDECEQLCNRLAIMVGGKFKCLGYVPDLKLRYGTGFTIKVKLKESEPSCQTLELIDKEMSSQFEDSKLRENHAGMLTYFIRNKEQMLWSKVFQSANKFHERCADQIDEYSVNESTLEDIFLGFSPRPASQQQCHSTNQILNLEDD